MQILIALSCNSIQDHFLLFADITIVWQPTSKPHLGLRVEQNAFLLSTFAVNESGDVLVIRLPGRMRIRQEKKVRFGD